MIYYTVRNTSGGFYGHQLKDLIGGYTLGKYLGLEYVHSYYPYLESFGIGVNQKKIESIPYDIDSIIIGGPYWGGISIENANNLKDRYAEYINSDKDLLIYFVNATRLFPHQLINSEKPELFDNIHKELTERYEIVHRNDTTYFDSNFFNVAIQIRQGDANDKEKYPEHFTQHTNARYQYPIEHYIKIMEQLRSIDFKRPIKFHIYSEGYNNGDLDTLKDMNDVEIHLSFTSNKNDNKQAYEDFMHLIKADLLVATTSSFSSMAVYFRYNKYTLYHPYDHLNNLPSDFYISIDKDGNFELNIK